MPYTEFITKFFGALPVPHKQICPLDPHHGTPPDPQPDRLPAAHYGPVMRGPRKLKSCATLGVSGLENECTIDLHVPGYGGGKGIIYIHFH